MEKLATSSYPINALIAKRWSPRAFDSKRYVDKSTLGTLFEAVRWAPSAGNLQPWRFMVGVNFDETHERVFRTLNVGNQSWTKNAPVLLIALARLTQPNDDGPNPHAIHDLGLAMENLFLQAVDLGLYCHFMAGFSPEKVRATFGVPNGYEPMTAGAIGYPGSPDDLPDNLRQRELRPRERNSLKEFVYTGQWEKPLDLD